MNQTKIRKEQIEAERRRDMIREQRLFVAAFESREVYLDECRKVATERAAERAS